MITKEEVVDYLENVEVWLPTQPTKKYSINSFIPNLRSTVNIIFSIIEEDADSSLNRLRIDFYTVLSNIIKFKDINELPKYTEDLAQLFETFVKKVGYFKYENNPYYFFGDEKTAGITGTTLDLLLHGKLSNKYGNNESLPLIELPNKIFHFEPQADSKKKTNKVIADYVRINLRNAVHYCKDRPRNEYILYSEIVLFLYLLLIQDNYEFLSERYLPEERYRKSIKEKFKIWQSRFVHILGIEETVSIIDNIDLDFIESDFDLSEIEDDDDSENPDDKFSNRESGKISELLSSKKRLVIVGSPGMGKTTTMQFLCFQLAKSNDKIPVYLELRNFTEELDLSEELLRIIGIEESSFYELLNSERLVILIDGVNEVIRKEARTKLFQQVNYLLKLSDKFHFIASSRKSSYNNDFNLPIFQLQLMNDEQIIEFISKNYDSNYSSFFELLKKNSRINEWARNPLMLTMLITVAKKYRGRIPDNTGKLLKTFIDGIYKREIRRNPTFNSEIAKILLSHLAFTSRENKLVGFSKAYALQVLTDKKNELGLSDDILGLLNSFIDINILYENEGQIGFTHELYQEYFAAEELRTLFSLDHDCIVKYADDKNWLEVIILFNGLVDGTEAIKAIARTNPLVAAFAVNDTTNPNINLVDLIRNEARVKFMKGEDVDTIANSIKTLISLRKLDEVYSLLIQSDVHDKAFKKAVRKAMSECYEIVSHNEMINILEMVWRLFIDTATNLNFISAFFKNIPLNGLNELDNAHKELGNLLTIKFLDYYFGKTLIRDSEESIQTVHRTYLIKPLIVIEQINLSDNTISKKVFSVVKTLIGIGKAELAYPILKKFKLENRVDLLKIVTKLVKKNSPEKAKLLANLFYDDDFAVDNKREKILRIALKESSGVVYKTAVELTLENGYKEKLSDIIDESKLVKINNKQAHVKITIPEPILQFRINTELSIDANLQLFNSYCKAQPKFPMKKYIEMFLKQYPGEFSQLFKLLGENVYQGTIAAKFEYGVFVNCPIFQRTKTAFAHFTATKEPFESLQEKQEVNFRIVGYSSEKQRINVRLC